MKPFTAVVSTAIVLAFVVSASAQRGGASRGGFSSHSSPSFHSSFAPSAHYSSGPAYRYSSPSFAPATRMTSAARYSAAPSAVRSNFYSSRRSTIVDRRRYAPRVRIGVPYAYPGVYGGYADYGLLDPGYTDAAPYDNSYAQSVYSGPQQEIAQQQVAPPPPPPTNNQHYARPPQAALPEEAVTLVFKDGRPSEQIHNYMLTRTMLYVHDEHRRDIPVDQLDLAATQKANQANGVEFALPKAN